MALMTLKSEAFAETEEKKSRFLGYVVPIAEFEARLAALRVRYDAIAPLHPAPDDLSDFENSFWATLFFLVANEAMV
ncbi:MAG: hypothetical protein ACPG4M_00945, partial [Alphaproteobacteria bacterium]